MWLKLVFSFAIFEVALAVSGYSAAGRRFSIPLPKVGDLSKSFGYMHITTEERRASVVVNYPKSQHTADAIYYQKRGFALDRYESIGLFMPSKYTWEATGIYNTWIVQASASITVTVIRTESRRFYGDTFNAIPEESCFKQYYVSTGKGFGFLAVMNFDSQVKISVTFPKAKEPFDVRCDASRDCASNSMVEVILAKNKAWYFKPEEKKVRFLNTLVEADKPVYVVAGNGMGSINGRPPFETVITSIAPTDSWGKEYITPRFIHSSGKTQKLILQFNVRKLPFRFRIFDGVNVRYTFIEYFDFYFMYNTFDRAYIISADVPFGLYQLFSYKNNDVLCDRAIVNVIPIEQWSNGGVITYLNSEDIWTNVVYTTADKDGVLVHEDTKSMTNSIEWEEPIRHKQRTYNYGLITIRHVPAKVFTKDPTARLLVYRFSQPKTKAWSCHAWPLHFYRPKIYHEKCQRTLPISNDGVDNDCDGYIDEEEDNGKDDDDDGKIDEDLIDTNRKNDWTSWIEACVMDCGEKNATIKVRSCMRKRFGKNCRGEDKICEPGPTCPENCKPPVCTCLEGCEKCQNNTPLCTECKDGYYGDKYCLHPCLEGGSGTGCADEPLGGINKDNLHTEIESENDGGSGSGSSSSSSSGGTDTSWGAAIPSVMVCLLLTVLVFVAFTRFKRKRGKGKENKKRKSSTNKKRKKEEDDEEEEGNEDEEDEEEIDEDDEDDDDGV